jgi:soluble lytic murein transglycosylase-like protein
MSESTARRKELFAPLVRAAAQAHGLPEALLHAVIEVESGFDAGAVSPRGALGLMQLMPDTARELRVRDARDPAANIDGGARYLKELLARFGNDLSLALAAYNAGPGAVQRSGGIPRNAETQNYVPRVMARYQSLQNAGTH